MRGNLKDDRTKIDNADKAARAALERKRKIIMQSKQLAYDSCKRNGTFRSASRMMNQMMIQRAIINKMN